MGWRWLLAVHFPVAIPDASHRSVAKVKDEAGAGGYRMLAYFLDMAVLEAQIQIDEATTRKHAGWSSMGHREQTGVSNLEHRERLGHVALAPAAASHRRGPDDAGARCADARSRRARSLCDAQLSISFHWVTALRPPSPISLSLPAQRNMKGVDNQIEPIAVAMTARLDHHPCFALRASQDWFSRLIEAGCLPKPWRRRAASPAHRLRRLPAQPESSSRSPFPTVGWM